MYPRENSIREKKDLSGIWRFRMEKPAEEGSQWFSEPLRETIAMPVPASYNDVTQDMSLRDHVGSVWYETTFYIPRSWKGKRVSVRFGSVTHRGTVWVNGQYITEHTGGYMPFEGDISKAVDYGKENRITVRVDNRLDYRIMPPGEIENFSGDMYPEGYHRQLIRHDFFNYAGIHRPVIIYCTEQDYIEDITVHTDIDNGDGIVRYSIDICGAGEVKVELKDKEGAVRAAAEGADGELRVCNPHLWDIGYGYLYQLHVMLIKNGELTDEYHQPVGIRTFKVDGKQLLLNGRPIYLTGFGRHEDSDIRGKGLDNVLNVKDSNLMEWIGANSFRTSHYPYSEEIMDLADQQGVLVIDECTAVGINSWNANEIIFCPERVDKDALKHHKQVLSELIARDKNRPGVVIYSVANEAATHEEGAVPYFEEIIAHTRKLDPTRPVMIVQSSTPEECRVSHLADIIGVNRYYSWYSDSGELDLIERQTERDLRIWHERFNKPVMMTEFGADTTAGFHSDPPQMFSEEYQAEFVKRYFNVFDRLDFVVGEHIWNFADFNTKQGTTRVMGNKKGIFTRQRQPKLAAQIVRERWKKINQRNK